MTPAAQAVRLQIYRYNGQVMGAFRHPDNGNKDTILYGVILQDLGVAGGFFNGPSLGGTFWMEGD